MVFNATFNNISVISCRSSLIENSNTIVKFVYSCPELVELVIVV